MKAYYVFNQADGTDHFVTPENDQLIPANKDTMYQFISAQPDFSEWQGEPLDRRPPDAFGIVVASRQEDGDVCIREEDLWHQRMTLLLGSP